jgi:hypothetical protein
MEEMEIIHPAAAIMMPEDTNDNGVAMSRRPQRGT